MERPVCKSCGEYPVATQGKKSDGSVRYKKVCRPCDRKPYRKHKKGYCEMCGFIPKHRVQLDVDHIDGNHNNDDPGNLQTICANCHRLKTYLNKETTTVIH